MRKGFNAEFKSKVALDAIKEEKTIAERSSKYEVHRTQITDCRKRALAGVKETFKGKWEKDNKENEKLVDELYRQICQLKVENEWLKKKLHCLNIEEKRCLIESGYDKLSIRRQCELLDLHRSNYYYEPVPIPEDGLRIMRRIDEIFTECPFYGSRKILEGLRREGFEIGRERVQAYMRQMGLRAIYPKVKTSRKHPEHKIYSYLLVDTKIDSPDRVWGTDITYIRFRLTCSPKVDPVVKLV